MELNILWLWPDILNLHGDRGNAMALVRICKLYGIEAKVTRVNRLGDDFEFESADIALLGAGELSVMPEITGALSKRHSEINDWTKSGGILFATGTSGAALGSQTHRTDGSHIIGLGLLDMVCHERLAPLGDDLIFNVHNETKVGNMTFEAGAAHENSMPIFGIQIQMIDISLARRQKPFGRALYGYGNNGKGDEGAVREGILFTNALGPVLVKNPWLTLGLIRKALGRKAPGIAPDALRFDRSLFETELASAKAIAKFNETKKRPK
jgi:CobQ-like glutamine amidotransferase family enzyme